MLPAAMKHRVPHDLDQAHAKQVAIKAWESYSQRFSQYDPEARWVTEDRAEIKFRVKGLSLTGEIEVEPEAIALELEVPFVLRPFKSKAISIIEGEIASWIRKAKNGELD